MDGKSRTGRVGVVAVAALLAAGSAAAESEPFGAERTVVVPGAEGLLGTYRVLSAAGPGPTAEQEAALASFCEESEGGCRARPRLLVDDDGTLDLTPYLRGADPTVHLGARLRTERSATLHLLVGVSGELSIRLDGVEVFRHRTGRFRRDDAVARLDLAPGDHALVLRFVRRGSAGRWRASLRWLDGGFRPGTGEVEVSVGRLDDGEARRAAARAVRFEESHVLGEEGPEAVVRVSLPAGGVARPVVVGLGGDRSLAPEAGLFSSSFEHRVAMPASGRLSLAAQVEDRGVKLGRNAGVDRRVLAAAFELRAALEKAPPASRGPMAWRLAEMERVVAEGDPDGGWRNLLIREAVALSKAVRAGRDPFAEPRGYQRMGFVSRMDDTAQGYELFVPPGYRGSDTRRWPLVVTLHGFKGNAGDYFRNTFGLARDFDGGESLLAHGRHGEAPTKGPMFVISPTGRGQAMYRHAGETDVLEALEDARSRFRIDPDRIYITGGSMGGTGAAYLPYRHPDLFAASAALAGYHDQRVRHDTRHEALTELERFLRAERGDIDWAENGLHMHTLLVRGTRDWPLEWTRSLARRLEELGYPYEHREPEARHNVWTITYAGGAIFRYFARFRRPEAPREVRLRTARERTRSSYWVSIDERAEPDQFGDVHARVSEDGLVTVTTEGVRALTLSPPEAVVPAGPVRVVVDGTRIEGSRPLSLHRVEGEGWEPAPVRYPLPGHKRAGASGPIRDVFHGPLLFVVGTADPGHTVVNRLVAEHWARPKGWHVHYRIVDDTEVTDEMAARYSLVLVGPPSSNRLLARWADRLPITIDGEGVGVGPRCYSGPEVGTVFVAPSPASPDLSLLVIAGPSPLGTWRSTFLTDVLPDFVVFDERIAPARGEWTVSGTGASALEAGLFGMDWSVPATLYD